MLPEELNLVLKKHKKKIFIYAWEFFTMRIHEELVRSVLENSPFFYVEIKFDIVYKALTQNDDRINFWTAFFEYISTQKRSCDLCGFLNNYDGVALMFLDSTLNAKEGSTLWDRFCTEIQARTFSDMRKWEGIISAEYPPKEFFTSENA